MTSVSYNPSKKRNLAFQKTTMEHLNSSQPTKYTNKYRNQSAFNRKSEMLRIQSSFGKRPIKPVIKPTTSSHFSFYNQKLEQQLDEISQMGKDLNMLKKLSMKSKDQISKLKNMKIGNPKQRTLSSNDRELLKIARKYPNNTNLQNQRLRLLQKNNLIALSESSKSHSVQFSDDGKEDNKLICKKDLCRIGMGMNSTKQLEAIQEGINACKGELGFFNPQRMFDLMNVMQKKEDPQAY